MILGPPPKPVGFVDLPFNADLSICTEKNIDTLLRLAFQSAYLSLLQSLVDHFPTQIMDRLQVPNSIGQYFVHRVLYQSIDEYRIYRFIQWLIPNTDVDICATDKWGRTVTHSLFRRGYIRTALWLIRTHGAGVDSIVPLIPGISIYDTIAMDPVPPRTFLQSILQVEREMKNCSWIEWFTIVQEIRPVTEWTVTELVNFLQALPPTFRMAIREVVRHSLDCALDGFPIEQPMRKRILEECS
jgi:hypothetical protein